ncbi:MAG: hypothetical protein WDN28_00890 [Chthoniobacter sp.]
MNGGAAFATNSGDQIVAYTGYTDIDGAGAIQDGTLTNVRINSGGGTATIASPTTNINTLTQNTAGAVTVDTGGGTIRVGTVGGVFVTPHRRRPHHRNLGGFGNSDRRRGHGRYGRRAHSREQLRFDAHHQFDGR